MRLHCFLIAVSTNVLLTAPVWADVTVSMKEVNAQGIAQDAGQVTISESPHGLVFTPELKGLQPGVHGFHVHEKPSCDPAEKDGKAVAAGAAGDHYDPEKSAKHGFPWGEGHLGDLPPIYADSAGSASNPVLSPRLKRLSDVSGRALMVHAGGDNHADSPKPAGGGGARVICGVIK